MAILCSCYFYIDYKKILSLNWFLYTSIKLSFVISKSLFIYYVTLSLSTIDFILRVLTFTLSIFCFSMLKMFFSSFILFNNLCFYFFLPLLFVLIKNIHCISNVQRYLCTASNSTVLHYFLHMLFYLFLLLKRWKVTQNT